MRNNDQANLEEIREFLNMPFLSSLEELGELLKRNKGKAKKPVATDAAPATPRLRIYQPEPEEKGE